MERFVVPYGRKIDIPCVIFAQGLSYQQQPVDGLAMWRHENNVPIEPDVAPSCIGKDKRQSWLVVKRRYWAREHHLKSSLCMHHKLLVGRHNFEVLSIMPADCDGSYLILPSWCDGYECPYILFVPAPLIRLYYSG